MKSISKKVLLIAMYMLLLLASGCARNQETDYLIEAEKAKESLSQSRHQNAGLVPEIPEDVSDIRIEIIDREYYVPSFEEDFQNLDLMQIMYGYNSDGVWYDYPSENYDLIGIMNHSDLVGWKAGVGSHMVKIGQYLLISICVQDHPLKEYEITDSLNSQIQEPFAQYYTYHYYYDEAGSKHSYMDDHDHGYGYIAENPAAMNGSVDTYYVTRCEFARRYYVLLDYESLPEEYRLDVLITDRNSETTEKYTLTDDMIRQLLEL